MSRTTNADASEQQEENACTLCLGFFGIIDETMPCLCINKECRQKFCAKCVNHIRTYNGQSRCFLCMYCLKKFPINCFPEEDGVLKRQLWNHKIIAYGVERTRLLLTTQCDLRELEFDIDCRRRQLKNLLATHKRVCNQIHTHETDIKVENMVNELSIILLELRSHSNPNIDRYKELYKQAISMRDNDEIGSLCIHFCEQLSADIYNDEFSSIFTCTHNKLNEWMYEHASGDEFHPKMFDLINAIEEDLISQWSQPCVTPRICIGFIGYTNAGKSSLLNRLLGVKSLDDDEAAPMRSMKATYYSLPFNRKEPLIYHRTNGNIQIPVTLVDIQGQDKSTSAENDSSRINNYCDEIKKANCDIYVLVFDDNLHNEQMAWITFIRTTLKRECVLVRSKVDIPYLAKMRELSGNFFSRCNHEQRLHYHEPIIGQIRTETVAPLDRIYLVAADYQPSSIDADLLLAEQSFDFDIWVNQLSYLAFKSRNYRIHLLAKQAVARVINTCFRRGYVLNVMKYKIAAGLAAIIPFGDQLPRYLSRDSIRVAFGINEVFCQHVAQFNLITENSILQTSVFKKYVRTTETRNVIDFSATSIGTTIGHATVAASSFSDDIVRIAAPTVTTVSTAGRIAFTVATAGVGVVISAGVCAWSAVSSGKHIFSYVNRLCDDCIVVMDLMIESIIEREKNRVITNIYPTAPYVD